MQAIHLIRDALFGIGQWAPGDEEPDADVELGFRVLNRMIDQWSNEPLACFAYLMQSIALQDNKMTYTIGPSVTADVNGPRPLAIEQIYLRDNQQNNYPVQMLSLIDWNSINTLNIQSQIPMAAYYDPQDPIASLSFYPIPIPPLYTAFWTSYLKLSEFPDLVTEIDFPDGYEAMIVPNLEVRLCRSFGKVPKPEMIDEANQTQGVIKRKNFVAQPAGFDREIVSRSSSTYNIKTDTYNY